MGEYGKRKIFVLVVTLLMILSTIVFISSDFEVEANPGGEGGDNGSIGLDFDFMWDITGELCDVIWNAYGEGDIRKGRAFGTKGDKYAAEEIIEPYMEEKLRSHSLRTNTKK